ncbi:hypothetical protein ACFL6D_00245 [Spirochaetota bacterium]
MELKYKPDFERARDVWNHYWEGEIIKRPVVVAEAIKNGKTAKNPLRSNYYNAITKNYDQQLKLIDEWFESLEYMAESIPYFSPDHGPDQFAAFLGAKLDYSKESSETTWVESFVKDWKEVLPMSISDDNEVWKSITDYAKILKDHSRGKYLVGICDFHSNIDTLCALRKPEEVCMDFYDYPEVMDTVFLEVRKLYRKVYDKLYEASGMNSETGSIGWVPFWCEGRFATLQADFIAVISPEMSRRYVIPALEEEAETVDRCAYHLDGPDALRHMDDILSIKKIDVIQWVSGAGSAPQYEWIDVFKKCQAAGKGLMIIGVNLPEIKRLHKELKPEGIVYCVDTDDKAEIEEIITWLEKNT